LAEQLLQLLESCSWKRVNKDSTLAEVSMRPAEVENDILAELTLKLEEGARERYLS
jgi:hypothetical protein